METHVVIMAGGIGSRFWPMSTPEKPKQFIDVLGCGKTLLQLTADRFCGVCPPENIWVVTSKSYFNLVHEQLPQIPKEHILLEPCMRNTAPCIAYAAWKIKTKSPLANIVVTPADHIVIDTTEFKRVITKALNFTEGNDSILTLGMKATRPETGYGYIAADLKSELPEKEIFSVQAFKEKPNMETAKEYLEAGNYFWNAGIFVWNTRTIEQAFKNYEPEMAAQFDKLSSSFYTAKEQEVLDNQFPNCKSISIDYAVMERSNNIYVFPSDFGWSDLGTWGSLREMLTSENAQNAIVGDRVKMIESEGCMVHVPTGKRVVIQGLTDYIIAEENNTLLICKLSDEQRIKEFSSES